MQSVEINMENKLSIFLA